MNITVEETQDTSDLGLSKKRSEKETPEKSRWYESLGNRNPKLPAIILYATIGLLAFLTRIIKIGFSDKGTPVFDEKHYSIQAYQMLLKGMGLEDNHAYGLIVHPPLGKTLISFGEALFGYSPLGWRLSSIIAGTVIILLLMGIIHRLTSSLALTAMAGLLGSVESVLVGMSRVGMLDIFIALFCTLAAFFVVMNLTTDNTGKPWHQRWYLLAAGISIGLAMGVKISGVYYAAILGILMVIGVAWKYRSIKETLKATGMGLVYFFIVPVVTYLLTWTQWFAGEATTYRRLAEAGKIEHEMPGWLSWIMPNSLESFYSYQMGVLKFHTGLNTSAGQLHPWESKPWQWLVGNRPMLFMNEHTSESMFNGGGGKIEVWLHANPVIWWITIPVLLFGIIAFAWKRDLAWGVMLTGYGINYLPWLIGYDRQMYFFYTPPMAVFLVMGIILVIRDLSKIIRLKASWSENKVQWTIFGIYFALVLALFIIYIPWTYGLPMSDDIQSKLRLFDNWEALKENHYPLF